MLLKITKVPALIAECYPSFTGYSSSVYVHFSIQITRSQLKARVSRMMSGVNILFYELEFQKASSTPYTQGVIGGVGRAARRVTTAGGCSWWCGGVRISIGGHHGSVYKRYSTLPVPVYVAATLHAAHSPTRTQLFIVRCN